MSNTNIVPARKFDSLEALLLSGACIFLGEYRGAKADVIQYTSKKDGKVATMGMINHVVETGSGMETESARVTQMVPDGTDPYTIANPFRKGQRVVVLVAGSTVERGVRKYRCEGIYDLDSMTGLESLAGEPLPGEAEDLIPGVRG